MTFEGLFKSINNRLFIYIGLLIIVFIAIAPLGVSAESAPVVEWENNYHTGVSWDDFYSVAECSDGGYVFAGLYDTYTYYYQGWVLKTNSTGSVVFNMNYGGTASDYFNSVAECSDGGYILAGQTGSYGAGYFDGWVMKVNSSGYEEWNYTFGGSYSDYFSSVAICPDGGYVLAGRCDGIGYGYTADGWIMKLNASGGVVWNKTYEGGLSGGDYFTSIILDSGGGYIAVGSDMQYYPLYGQGWITKLNSTGDVVWNSSFGGSSEYDSFSSVAVAQDGGYVMVGRNDSAGNGSYLWALKVNSTGGLVWDRSYGGYNNDRLNSVANCSDGGFVIAGRLGEGYVLKINSSGGVVWSMVPGGPTNDGLYSVANCSDGGYILAGYKNVDYYDNGWALKLYYPPIVSHTVNGTITYHGFLVQNAAVNVTTSVGTYSNTTDNNGEYIVQAQVYDWPGETITVEATYGVPGLFSCSNTTGPVTPTGNTTTVNVSIAPPKAHRFYGVITFCGIGQSGTPINVTTPAGTWNSTTGPGGTYDINITIYECGLQNYLLANFSSYCGNFIQYWVSPVTGNSTNYTQDYNVPMPHTIVGNITYHSTGQAGATVDVTTKYGTYTNTTGPNGSYSVSVSICGCPCDPISVSASYNGCTNTTNSVILQCDTNITTVDLDIAPPKSHNVNGTVTYHGVGQAGATVNVTTNAGTYSNTTGADGEYTVAVQVYDCPQENITAQASYAGCSNTTGPIVPAGNDTTLNVSIAPPKVHTVSGTITYHGAGQAGAVVNVTTNMGSWLITSGSGGTYTVQVQLYECPAANITVYASYDGRANSTVNLPTGSATTVNVDIEPVDPCDCLYHTGHADCTYWDLPGCTKPAPPGITATTTATANTTATTTATTRTTTTTTTTATSTTTTTTNTTVPTTTTTTTLPPQDNTALYAGLGILALFAVLLGLYLFLRR